MKSLSLFSHTPRFSSVRGDAATHFFNVGPGMKIVTVVKGPSQFVREPLANGGFARPRNTHQNDNHGRTAVGRHATAFAAPGSVTALKRSKVPDFIERHINGRLDYRQVVTALRFSQIGLGGPHFPGVQGVADSDDPGILRLLVSDRQQAVFQRLAVVLKGYGYRGQAQAGCR